VLTTRAPSARKCKGGCWRQQAKLGYQPNPIAQALSTRRTHILGLVLLSPTQLTHPYTAAIVQGALEVAHQHGYHVTLIPTEQWRGALSRDPRVLTMTDGLIITTRRSILPDDLARVHQQVPVVLVQFRFPDNAMPSVHADYRLAAQLIADHLRQRAVKEVGVLWARGISPHPTKPVLRSVFEEDFLPNFQKLLKESGIAFDPSTDIRSVLISTDVAAIRKEVKPVVENRPAPCGFVRRRRFRCWHSFASGCRETVARSRRFSGYLAERFGHR